MTRAGDWNLVVTLADELIADGAQSVAVSCPIGTFQRDGVCEDCLIGAVCEEPGLEFETLRRPAS